MRAFLVAVAVIAVVAAVIFLIYRGGKWQPTHYADNGATVVAVVRTTPAGKVIEENLVARIPDNDDDWSRKFLDAKLEAEERAFHLNADRGPDA